VASSARFEYGFAAIWRPRGSFIDDLALRQFRQQSPSPLTITTTILGLRPRCKHNLPIRCATTAAPNLRCGRQSDQMTSARTTRWDTPQVEHSQDNSSGSYARTCRALTVGYDPSDITDLSSITSSATASNSGGILRPSALAVFRLIASSNLIGGSSTRGTFMMMRHLITFLDRRGRFRPQTKSDIPCNGVCAQRVASLSTTQRYIEGSTAAKRRVVNM
jgi:hypothetical protein